MAQIVPNYQQNGYNPGDQLAGIAQKAPPTGAYQAQQAQPQAVDPLFEALARYITSGPGASSVSTKNLQDIIETYSGDPGREYLQSIVQPQYGDALRIWEHSLDAKGHIYTNLTNLSLVLSATPHREKGEIGIPYVYGWKSQATGFFPTGQFLPIDGRLFYDGEIKNGYPSNIDIEYDSNAWQIKIKFFHEVSTNPGKHYAELVIDLYSISLPDRPRLPPLTKGQGVWTIEAQ